MENLGFLAWIELVTTLIIYVLNWVLMPAEAAEGGSRKKFGLLLGVYAVTLFASTSYILWQFTVVNSIPVEVSWILLVPTFALNYLIEAVVCPILIRTMSAKLRTSGVYAGNFWEWRKHPKTKPA